MFELSKILPKFWINFSELMNNFSFFNFWEIMMKRVWWVGIEAIFLHFDRTLGKWDRTWKWGLIYIKVIQPSPSTIPFSAKSVQRIVEFHSKTDFALVYFLRALLQRVCELRTMNNAQWIKIFVSPLNSWIRYIDRVDACFMRIYWNYLL